jgi:hypothetical protein
MGMNLKKSLHSNSPAYAVVFNRKDGWKAHDDAAGAIQGFPAGSLKFSFETDAFGRVTFGAADAAVAILSSIESLKFSGRCEYYGGGDCDLCVVGVSFRFLDSNRKCTLEDWWDTFEDTVATISSQNGRLEMDRISSELTTLHSVRASLSNLGAVEFVDGLPKFVLEDADSMFIRVVKQRLKGERK